MGGEPADEHAVRRVGRTVYACITQNRPVQSQFRIHRIPHGVEFVAWTGCGVQEADVSEIGHARAYASVGYASRISTVIGLRSCV